MRKTLVVLLLATISSMALALPQNGTYAPHARAQSVDGTWHSPQALTGKIVLVFYEDKGSQTQNNALKAELHRLHLADKLDARLVIFPVADLRGYAFWPLRGIARSTVKAEGKKFGLDVLCDWNGAFGDAFQVKRGVSNLVLIDTDGRVNFTSQGAVSAQERVKLLERIRKP